MRKIYILDTNVILYDPYSFEKFEDNIVIIPAIVLEEIDNFKKYYDLRGFSARQFSRKLDKIRQKGDLTVGVKINKQGGILKIVFNPLENLLPDELKTNQGEITKQNDNMILNICLYCKTDLADIFGATEVILVSKDINMRIKANYLGIKSEEYKNTQTNTEIETNGSYLVVNDNDIDFLYKEKILPLNKVIGFNNNKEFKPYNNSFYLIKSIENPKKSALVIYKNDKNFERLELLNDIKTIMGISPRNYKQHFLLHAILDTNIDIVFAMGIAGSGKTLLSIASALELVLDGIYEKLIIARPIIPLGKDPGALPGDALEKTRPWLQPIYDNLDYILRNIKSGKIETDINENELTIDYLEKSGAIEIQPLAYVRGRSLTNCIFLCDESQNLTPHEIKTIISRVGSNSKIILTGDIHQIDNPYLTPQDNGLSFMAERFRLGNYDSFTTIYLDKGERSKLASFVSKL